MRKEGLLAAVIFVLLMTGGCAHSFLAHDHVLQARTLTQIHEQQVLDNLAMFAKNPDALAFYSVPGAGSATVTDNGSLSLATLNGPGRSVLGPLRFARDNRLVWAALPITDPRRLERMGCAYRAALGIDDGCIDCMKLRQDWEGSEWEENSTCGGGCSSGQVVIEDCRKTWLGAPCDKVGSYCGCHIRVCPSSYKAFSQLVSLIMDYAVNEPAAAKKQPTMQVEQYFYEGNRIVKKETYTATIREPSQEEATFSAKAKLQSGDLEGVPTADDYRLNIAPRSVESDINLLQEFQKSEILRQSVFPDF